MLVLAPAACCLAGTAAHEALLTLTRSIRGRLAAKAQSPMEGSVNLDSGADKGPGREAAAAARPELSKRASRKAGDGGKVGLLWVPGGKGGCEIEVGVWGLGVQGGGFGDLLAVGLPARLSRPCG